MGGVLCLTLGKNKPENFDEILNKFDEVIKDKKHHIISVYDSALGRFMGDAELLITHNNIDYVLLSFDLIYLYDTHYAIEIYRYGFNRNGYYSRTIQTFNCASVNDFNSLQSQIDELKQKLNEITQTE